MVVDRFGVLLAVILVSIAFTMAAPAGDWGPQVALVLQVAVLVAALQVADASTRLTSIGGAVAGVLVLIALGADLSGGTSGGPIVWLLGVLLVAAAIMAIVVRLAQRGTRVDGHTVLGAVCVYLLLGALFTFAFGAVAASGDFFTTEEPASLQTLQYFSLTTLTTVGYGDLAPVTSLGRSLAVIEALLGQIYLVTVVALLVGNLGRSRPAGRAHESEDDPPLR